jgi:hypothetical protein
MKRIACIVLGGTLALLTGCATTGVTPQSQSTTESGGDGAIKQRVEFKDLTAWEQEVIVHGGGD